MAAKTYRLIVRHRINGQMRDPGYEVTLPQEHGDWLVAQGVMAAGVATAPPMAAQSALVKAPRHFDPPPKMQRRCCGWT